MFSEYMNYRKKEKKGRTLNIRSSLILSAPFGSLRTLLSLNEHMDLQEPKEKIKGIDEEEASECA